MTDNHNGQNPVPEQDDACLLYTSNLTFSTTSDFADVTAKNIRLFPDHVEYQVVSRGCINRVSVAMPGGFNVKNTLGVITACLGLGIAQADAVAALKTCKGVKGRIEVVPTDTPYTCLLYTSWWTRASARPWPT